MAASRKQLFTSLTNKDEYTSSTESSDEDFDSGGSSYSPSDTSSAESDMVSLTEYLNLSIGLCHS
jgi:hypothetical protein